MATSDGILDSLLSPRPGLTSTSATTNTRITGYEAVFDPPVDRKYVCPICLAVMRDPMQTRCGHRFCYYCIQELSRPARSIIQCPVDKTVLNIECQLFDDNAINREILSLTIKCDHHEAGCEWTGELREQENHLENCPFVLEVCPNEGCVKVVKRKEMAEHQDNCLRRKSPCPSCDKMFPFAEMSKHFLLDCPKFPVNCTGCHRVGIQRDQLAKHKDPELGDCPETTVSCPFAYYGCTMKDKRKNMNEHCRDGMQQHLVFIASSLQKERATAISCINKLSERIKDLENELEEVKGKVQRLKQ